MHGLPKQLVWTDSVAMGVILIIIGLCVCIEALAGFLPSLIGAAVVGVIIAGAGVVLVRQGMSLRPRVKTDG